MQVVHWQDCEDKKIEVILNFGHLNLFRISSFGFRI
jgi:hypothetical protein